MEVDPRVVQVLCTFSDNRRSTGSGYLLDDGLVLTAAHVVGSDEPGTISELLIQFVGSSHRYECSVAWHVYERARPERVRLDAAVLRIVDPDWCRPANLPRLRWGGLVTTRPAIPVHLAGFPTAMDARDEHGTLIVRDQAYLPGVVNAGTSAKGRRYHVTVDHPLPSSPTARHSRWEGGSGSAVICNGLLLGVVARAESEPRWAWLSAVPVPVLLDQPGFRELVGPVVAEPAELQPVLEQPVARQVISPVSLLRSENEVVGFDHERDEIVHRLREWCTGDGWFSVRMLEGGGGQGKTRLAAHLLAVVRELGWSCGFLLDRVRRPELDVVGDLTTPALLVIDYAETRAEQLIELLDVVDRRARSSDGAGGVVGAPAVRVLLLARDSGDWWTETRWESLLLRDLGPGVVIALPDLYAEDRRDEALRGVVRDLGRSLNRLPDFAGLCDELVTESVRLPDLGDDRFGRALDLHMAGLVALLQAIRPVVAGDEPDEAVLLRHEERFWKRTAASAGLGDLTLRGRRRLVATATLCVARDVGHASEILGRLRWRSPPESGAVASWLAALHPSDRDFWSPLRPDRVGEYLVGLALTDEPALLEQLLPAAEPEESRGALHVLARSASHQHHVAGPLERVITANPSRLAPSAVGVATAVERPEPLHRALATVVEDAQDDLVLLEQVYDAVPDHSQTLAVWAAELAGRVAELVSNDVQAGAKEFGDLAAALTHHAFRLDLAGHPEFALPRYEMAVRIYDQLARHTPGRHEADLATSIEGYAHQLYAAGERTKAAETIERAVALRREHAGSEEERRLLADALTGYGNHLSASGQYERAVAITQEAVDLYDALPDAVRETRDREHATALMTHAIALQENNRIDDSVDTMRHALAGFRRMVKRFPDAYRPDLAAALTNFAELLAEVAQPNEALACVEESVAHYEELAIALPGAHEANHAAALHCLAGRHADLERWPEAARCAERAVGLLDVVTADRDEHRLELGTALDMWAIALSECGRTDEAVAAGHRAVGELRALAGDIAVRVQLATTLRNLAEVLREAGRAAEARPYSAEAVELCRTLAAEAPGVLEGELRLALLVHGGVLAEIGGAPAGRTSD